MKEKKNERKKEEANSTCSCSHEHQETKNVGLHSSRLQKSLDINWAS